MKGIPHLAAVLALTLFSLAPCTWAQEHSAHPATPAENAASAQAEHEATAEGSAAQQEHGEEDHHAAFKYSPSVQLIGRATGLPVTSAYWLALLVNFVIIAGVVFWIWRSVAPAAFRARSAAIQHGMEEARKASEDANRRLGDVETRLARLDTEIAALRSEAETEAAAEEARLRAAAEEDKARIIEAARQEIDAASRQAQRELKAYAAELAVSLAEKRIHVDAAADRALFSTFVEQLANGEKS